MRAARVLGHVAAQGAGRLARGVGGVVQAVRRRGDREARVHHAGLDQGEPVLGIYAENTVQPGEDQQHGGAVREGPAGQPGPGAPRHDGNAMGGQQPYHRDDFLPAPGQHHDRRHAAVGRQAIPRVGDAFGRRGAHVLRAHDARQRLDQRRGDHVACSIWGCGPPRPLLLAR